MSAQIFIGKPCKHGHDGTRYVATRACVSCQIEAKRRYRQSPKGRASAKAHNRKPERLEKQRQRSRAARNTPEGKRKQIERDIWTAWKMTPEQYDSLIASGSENGCSICGNHHPECGFVLDHDRSCCATHKTCGNCIRGVLCRNCNTAIGMLNDNRELLLSAARYLASICGNELSDLLVPSSSASRARKTGTETARMAA